MDTDLTGRGLRASNFNSQGALKSSAGRFFFYLQWCKR